MKLVYNMFLATAQRLYVLQIWIMMYSKYKQTKVIVNRRRTSM